MLSVAERAELQVMVDELEDAAMLSCDELTEWWEALTGLFPRILDCASEEFRDACIQEIKSEHARFKAEFSIETVTDSRGREYRVLRHEDE